MGKLLRFALIALTTLLVFECQSVNAQFQLQEDPINYYSADVNDPVAKLKQKLESGSVTLKRDDKHGYLVALLDYLDVPISSQVLVFSKTSFQRFGISPATPRALYFNDDVYIGYVQTGDVLEISSVDPQQGAVFYSLEQEPANPPRVARQIDKCILCHASTHTKGVPGHFVRSVFPSATGMPFFGAGTYRIDQSSPIERRWGGWYVTGQHGKQRHMGNVIAKDRNSPEILDVEDGANVSVLSDRFDTDKYLSQHSDIVALMVLEHQADMHNYITVANYQARLALRDETVLNSLLERPRSGHSEATIRRFNNAAERLVKYMLFVDEAKLTDTIKGSSEFATQFTARGPCDTKGRSLRDFDLQTRIFKYPCSYLIYSDAFAALPQPVLDQVYLRLWEILTGQDESPVFAHLSPSDRFAILEILRDTKSGLPAYWDPKATGE